MSEFLIVNTKTDNQNPNVLCAQMINNVFTPVLMVASGYNFPSTTLFTNWTAVKANGKAYRLQICDADNNVYYLGVQGNLQDGTSCSLFPANQNNSSEYTEWTFPFSNRMLLDGTGNSQYSADAGEYPDLVIWGFNSGESQTWQFGATLNSLSDTPPGVSQ